MIETKNRHIVVSIDGRWCVVAANQFRPQAAVTRTYTKAEAVALAKRLNDR